jgi:prevent-host-death family protein
MSKNAKDMAPGEEVVEIESSELRRRLSFIMDEVFWGGVTFRVRVYGQPTVVLISPKKYEQIRRYTSKGKK